MRAEIQSAGRAMTLHLRLDPEDHLEGSGQMGMAIELVTNTATIRFPETLDRPHPDLLALIAFTILEPWCRRRLTIAGGVSAGFAEAVRAAFGIEVGPVDSGLMPRSPGRRIGLMYSGGPDCMAAEALLGAQLPLFHFRRIRHPRTPNRMTHVRVDLQEALVRQAQERGEEVHVCESDLEFLCRPFATFPQWNAMMVGAMAQADRLDLGGLVTGRNISGIYLGWGNRFEPDGEREAEWESVFEAVGLPLIQPLAGLSDVVSKRLARDHRLFDLARSCLTGTQAGPCGRCDKCAKNELMEAADGGEPLAPDWDDRYAANGKLDPEHPLPFSAQHLLEYTLARIPNVDETFLSRIKERLKPTRDTTQWVERYYSPALAAHVPEAFRPVVIEALEDTVEFMTPEDERRVEAWDPAHR